MQSIQSKSHQLSSVQLTLIVILFALIILCIQYLQTSPSSLVSTAKDLSFHYLQTTTIEQPNLSDSKTANESAKVQQLFIQTLIKYNHSHSVAKSNNSKKDETIVRNEMVNDESTSEFEFIVDRNQFSLFYGIFTIDTEFELRMLIRCNLMFEKPWLYNIDTYFIMGYPKQSYKKFIQMENDTYHDIIILPIFENINQGKTYLYFTYITTQFMQHRNKNYTFIGKFDSDTYTRHINLYKFLLSHQIKSQISQIIDDKYKTDIDYNVLRTSIEWNNVNFNYWWDLGVKSKYFGNKNKSWIKPTNDVYFGFPYGMKGLKTWDDVRNHISNERKKQIEHLNNDTKKQNELIEKLKNKKMGIPFYFVGMGYGVSIDIALWLSNTNSFAFNNKRMHGEDATFTRWMFEDDIGNNMWQMDYSEANMDWNHCFIEFKIKNEEMPRYCKQYQTPDKDKMIYIHKIKTVDRWTNLTSFFFPEFDKLIIPNAPISPYHH